MVYLQSSLFVERRPRSRQDGERGQTDGGNLQGAGQDPPVVEKHSCQQQQWENTEIHLPDIHPYKSFAVHSKGEEGKRDQEALQSQLLRTVFAVGRVLTACS